MMSLYRAAAGMAVLMTTSLCVASASASEPASAPAPESAPTAAAAAPAPEVAPAAPEAPVRPREERTAFNSVFVELLGNGGLYSVNYDRMFGENWSARIGLGYIGINSVSLVFVPVMGNYLVGDHDHKLELGLGVVLLGVSARSSSGIGSSLAGDISAFGAAGTGTVGYRYAPQQGGFHFKVGFTPIFGPGGFLPWGGISFGGIF